MLLLETRDIRITKKAFPEDFEGLKYAILSHRWSDDEVTYEDFKAGRQRSIKGYVKVERFCNLARHQGFQYVWVDTCCINKDSSADYSEAINSMYQYYQLARECWVYMSDVSDSRRDGGSFESSEWFTRGWTLQELIAPSTVAFYDRDWRLIEWKHNIYPKLSSITKIDEAVLHGSKVPSKCSVAQRLSWAADRTTTRLEDRAYSLLGLMDVSMAPLYGEGLEKAFLRLQEEVVKRWPDNTIFAWHARIEEPAEERIPRAPSAVCAWHAAIVGLGDERTALAASPDCFKGLRAMNEFYPGDNSTEGHSLGNAGLKIRLLLIPWCMGTYLTPLLCGRKIIQSGTSTKRRYQRACIFVKQTKHDNHFVRMSCGVRELELFHGDRIARWRERYELSEKTIFIIRT